MTAIEILKSSVNKFMLICATKITMKLNRRILPVLEAIPEESWNLETIHDKCFEVIAQLDVKNGVVLWPLRTAISGKQFTPGGGIDLAEILGKACTIERVKDGIARLS
jgi:glutamyl-tRNA synthetase